MAGPIILRFLALTWFPLAVVAVAACVRERIFDGWAAAVAVVGAALPSCAFVVLAEIAEDVRRRVTGGSPRRRNGRAKGWTHERIARVIGVGRVTVTGWLKQFVESDELNLPEKVTGADGKKYPTKRAKPGPLGKEGGRDESSAPTSEPELEAPPPNEWRFQETKPRSRSASRLA